MTTEPEVGVSKGWAAKKIIFCTFAKYVAKNEEPPGAPLFAIFAIASNMNLT